MSKYTFVRARNEEDRCLKSNCPYEAVEGSDFCPRHGANKQLEKRAAKLQYDFKLERVRRKVNMFSADPSRYRLDEELGLMRLTLEDTINAITTRADADYALIQGSDTIRNLISTIEKLTQSCVSQSLILGQLMTREDLINQVQSIINILAEEIKDEETLLRIAERIDQSVSFQGDQGKGNVPAIKLGDSVQVHKEIEMGFHVTSMDEGDVEC